MLRRLAQPLIETLARVQIDIPDTEVDEPGGGLVEDLPVQLRLRRLRLHGASLPSASSRTSRHSISARARYFFAAGRDTPSSRPISSIDKPPNRCSSKVVDIFGGS